MFLILYIWDAAVGVCLTPLIEMPLGFEAHSLCGFTSPAHLIKLNPLVSDKNKPTSGWLFARRWHPRGECLTDTGSLPVGPTRTLKAMRPSMMFLQFTWSDNNHFLSFLFCQSSILCAVSHQSSGFYKPEITFVINHLPNTQPSVKIIMPV